MSEILRQLATADITSNRGIQRSVPTSSERFGSDTSSGFMGRINGTRRLTGVGLVFAAVLEAGCQTPYANVATENGVYTAVLKPTSEMTKEEKEETVLAAKALGTDTIECDIVYSTDGVNAWVGGSINEGVSVPCRPKEGKANLEGQVNLVGQANLEAERNRRLEKYLMKGGPKVPPPPPPLIAAPPPPNYAQIIHSVSGGGEGTVQSTARHLFPAIFHGLFGWLAAGALEGDEINVQGGSAVATNRTAVRNRTEQTQGQTGPTNVNNPTFNPVNAPVFNPPPIDVPPPPEPMPPMPCPPPYPCD